MTGERYAVGDVFWAEDPYRTGEGPRPWLVLAGDGLPYPGEEYICAGLTLSDLEDNVEIGAGDWRSGGDPSKTSFCSPWVLATVKHDAVAGPQGALTTPFTRDIVRRSREYLSGDIPSRR